MATQSTVELIFKGIDDASGSINSVSKSLQGFTTSAQNVVDPIAGMSTALIKTEAAILATGIAVTGLAIKIAGDFDQAFREVTTLIDAPTEALDEFRQAILDYARTSTASLEEITGAVYSAISAGVDYTDSLAFVRQAEQLAIAGNAGLNESLVGLVSTMNAYGAEADQAGQFSDILFSTVRLGQTTLTELNASLANVTGLAATVGVEFFEVNAAIATLTATGTPTSQAINQIQGALSAILKPTSDAQKLAEELGIEFNVQRLQAVGLEGILQDVQQATGGNAEQMARLFGRVEALNGVLTLTGLGADTFASNLDDIRSSAGATEEGVDKFGNAIGRSGNAITLFLEQLGRPFLDAFRDAKAAIGELLGALTDSLSDGSLGEINAVVIGIFEELTGTLQAAAANLPEALAQADFSGFIGGLEVIAEAVRGVFDGLDLTSVDGLVGAIELAGSAFLALSTFTASAIDALAPFFQAIASAVPTFLAWAETLAPLAGLLGGLSIAASTALPLINSLLLGVIALSGSGAFAGLGTVIGGVAAALTGPVGLTIAAGVAAGAVIALADSQLDLRGNLQSLVGTITGTAEAKREMAAADERLAAARDEELQQVQAIRREMDAWRPSIEDVSHETVKLAEEFQKTGKVMGDFSADELDTLITQFETQERIQGLVIDKTKELSSAVDDLFTVQAGGEFFAVTEDMLATAEKLAVVFGTDLANALQATIDAGGDYSDAYMALIGITEKTGEASQDLSTDLRAMAEAGEITKDKMAELQVQLAEAELKAAVELDIARLEQDTERLRIEAETWVDLATIRGDIEIAGIEATTQRVQAAFATIDTIILDTGDTIRTLIDAIAGVDDADRNARQKIEIFRDFAEREFDLRERAIASTEELNSAIAEELRARTQRLRSGEALITVDGGTLQPELEAFMFRILGAVQLRANADASALLLGI